MKKFKHSKILLSIVMISAFLLSSVTVFAQDNTNVNGNTSSQASAAYNYSPEDLARAANGGLMNSQNQNYSGSNTSQFVYIVDPDKSVSDPNEVIPEGKPSQWVFSKENSAWYRFDEKCNLVKGWFQEEGKWYFLDTVTGKMLSDVLAQIKNDLYHFNSSGVMQTGWVWDKNTSGWYFFSGSGAAVRGWYKDNDIWYYLERTTAKMVSNQLLQIDGKTYSFASSGAMHTGWVWNVPMVAWLYFDPDGGMHRGWVLDNGKWYFLDELTGKMHSNQFVESSGKKYYLTSDGSMATNCWQWDNTTVAWYYLHGDGTVHEGFLQEGDKKYYCQTGGAMAKGWIMVSGSKYYANSSGVIQIGEFEVDGKRYKTDAEGRVIGEPSGKKVGIDVSTWQGDIDWSRVKASGVDFAMIRSNFGHTGVDNKFYQNIDGAKAAGIKVGVYIYSYATNTEEARLEAENVLRTLGGRQLDYPIAYDLEDNCLPYDTTDIATTFCDIISNAGYKPMIYASQSWMEDRLDYNRIKGYSLWVAQWAPECTYKYRNPPDMWQYSSTGKIDGIDGNVDLDFGYM